MTMPISVKKKDGGRISGSQNVPQVIEVAMLFQLPNTKRMILKAHGSYTGTPPNVQTVAGALFTSLSASWGTNLGPYMATTTLFQSVQARDMTSFSNPISVGTGTAVPGTSASPAMPVNAAIVLTEQIAARGRGLKGRIFFGGWATNADAGSGQIASAASTALNGFGTALFNALNAQSLTPCVAQVARQQYQGVTGTVHPARNATKVSVTGYTVQDLNWDTQRRRGQA